MLGQVRENAVHSLQPPPELDLLLFGGGHAHVAVLRSLAMAPWPGVRATLVTREVLAPYSGMLPAHVAGALSWEAMHIDLGPLARAGGVRLIEAEVTGVDAAQRQLHFADRPPLSYDVLSVDSGITPALDEVPGARGKVLPTKPISTFLPRLTGALEAQRDTLAAGQPIRVVGGGAAGVELALALRARLGPAVALELLTAGANILPALPARVGCKALKALSAAGITVRFEARVAAVEDGPTLRLASGEALPAALVLWATQAAPPAWLATSALALDEGGFLAVGETLQSRSHPEVFAAGDVAALTHAPRPKSGVYAVRAGPVLTENLKAFIAGQPLRPFKPQRRALYLLNLGDGRSLAAHPWLPAWVGRPLWRLKLAIDERFMARFRLPPMAEAEAAPSLLAGRGEGRGVALMRCEGCGSKLGPETLRAGLAALPGEAKPVEDATPVAGAPGLWQSIDGFPLPVDDLYLGGRLAAQHALSDLYALGLEPRQGWALATVPVASDRLMARDLGQLMAGAEATLAAAGCELAGGHSLEGPRAELALTVLGAEAPGSAPLLKSGAQAEDVLILTKSLGVGVALAASAKGAASSRIRQAALALMLEPSAPALPVLRAHGVRALTDVTGFGLLGHALELAKASGLGLTLDPAAPVALDGVLPLLAAGEGAQLTEANAAPLSVAEGKNADLADPRVRLLCDPQTCGGLLAAVPPSRAEACLQALQDAGFTSARAVGRIRAEAGLSLGEVHPHD
jgi:selenide,water dikinase